MRARTNRYIAKSRCQSCQIQSWCITATSINSYIVDRRVDLKHIPSSKKKKHTAKIPTEKGHFVQQEGDAATRAHISLTNWRIQAFVIPRVQTPNFSKNKSLKS